MRPAQKPKPKPVAVKQAKTSSLLRGFKDILPAEMMYVVLLHRRISKVVEEYGFERMEVPLVEESGLFLRAIGRETDVVRKELFAWHIKESGMVALRPEGTAGVARAYINHGLWNMPQPVKVWYEGPMFRYDRPQAGRYRQFHQIGLEALGSDHPILDAEMITIAMKILRVLDIPARCDVNSIGCRVCRPTYFKALTSFVRSNRKLLCADCRERVKHNVLRVLDCKEEKCQKIYEAAPVMISHLCEDCKKHFTRVLEYCEEAGVPYVLQPRLVRGLDYYTRTVFELVPTRALVATPPAVVISPEGMPLVAPVIPAEGEALPPPSHRQDALGGGGRYDSLIEALGGKATPALGMAFGMERLLSHFKVSLDAAAPPQGMPKPATVFLAQLGDKARKKMVRLREDLMAHGIHVLDAFSKDGLRAQLEIASRLKVAYTLILGEKEVIEETIIVRDMNEGVQDVIPYTKVAEILRTKLAL